MDPSLRDTIILDSRLTPVGNGSDNSACSALTSGQRWWVSVLLGFIFAIISSPVAYGVSSSILGAIRPSKTNVAGLVIHTLIFILIIRVILW